ncbi:hypothetical protein CPB84DRAFT_1786654 [Gymnopilus junonius]|uniref:Uncharacterized protein n=1 Tax=Gymnopilus junonius TaxID=109634 RepID=A0A9P5NH99_GYMJU|nr:hypothetical protein CPB84DRAFT_1786654 [Gymnopilus junonius]
MRFNYPNENFVQYVDELAMQLGLSTLYLDIVYCDPSLESIYHAGREIWRLAPVISTLMFFKNEGYFMEYDQITIDTVQFSEEFLRLLERYRSLTSTQKLNFYNVSSCEREFEACRKLALNLMQRIDKMLMFQRSILLNDRITSFSKSDVITKLKRWYSFAPPPKDRIENMIAIVNEPRWCWPQSSMLNHSRLENTFA